MTPAWITVRRIEEASLPHARPSFAFDNSFISPLPILLRSFVTKLDRIVVEHKKAPHQEGEEQIFSHVSKKPLMLEAERVSNKKYQYYQYQKAPLKKRIPERNAEKEQHYFCQKDKPLKKDKLFG
ncbi:MAG: hypothetical protein PVF65_12660 [Sphingomonadales bacterium]|jgi:hypothetical protein